MYTHNYVNNLSPEVFLKPEIFKTINDLDQIKAAESYSYGRYLSERSNRIGISSFTTWFASTKDGRMLSFSKIIGIDSYTSDILKGFLDGGAEVVVYRYNLNPGPVIIKPRFY